MIQTTLNTGAFPPEEYKDRKTVKAVIVDGKGNSFIFSSTLIGGGVEEGETDEEALRREALEEAGIQIEIKKPLGEIIAYRDALKQRYVIHGYLCRYIKEISVPTEINPGEIEKKAFWEKIKDSINRLEAETKDLEEKGPASYEGDTYQAKLYNRKTMVSFLKEANADLSQVES